MYVQDILIFVKLATVDDAEIKKKLSIFLWFKTKKLII